MIDPNKIGRPPGLVGDLYEWINSTAGKPQPVLALAASLTYVGALGGRLVRGPCGERTNLYCLGVGPSCSGKEHARTQIKRLNRAAGITGLMGGEDVTSDAAIEMELSRQKRVLYLWDEVGHMFGNIKADAGGSHKRGIIPMLMKLYSSADKTYEGKSYADRQSDKARVSIDQPCLSLYGTTVPERLFDALDKGQLIDGFLSRCLLFETTENPRWDRRRARVGDIPEAILEQVRPFATRAPEMEGDGSDGNLIAASTANPALVDFTDPALEVIAQLDEIAHIMADDHRKKGSGFDTLWGRAPQNATKIALTLAVGCGSSVIDEEMTTWACNLTTELISDLERAVDGRVADSRHEKQRKRILAVIAEAGERGATKTEITRRTADMKARDRNDLLLELTQDFQSIVVGKIPGTRGDRYWLARYDKAMSADD